LKPTILPIKTTPAPISSPNPKQFEALAVGLLEGLLRALECFSATLDVIEKSI